MSSSDSVVVRHASAGDLPAAVALANQVFERTGRGDMGAEFALMFSPANAPNLCLAESGGRVVSLVGAMPFVMRIDGVRAPSASIGAVCTHPDFRGRGLAGRALELAIADARERGDLLMPISGNRTLYSRQRSACWGKRFIGRVRRDRLAPPGGRPFRDDDAEAVVALHESTQAVRYEWTVEDFRTLQDSFLVHDGAAWVHEGQGGRLDAWALLVFSGPRFHGQPGEAVLVDSVGEPAAVAACCSAAMAARGRDVVRCSAPWHDAAAADYWPARTDNGDWTRGWHTIKLLDLDRLVAAFAGRLAPLAPKVESGRLTLTVPGGSATTLADPEEIHYLLLCPADVWPSTLKLSRDLGRAVAGPLPIPVPDYGINYI